MASWYHVVRLLLHSAHGSLVARADKRESEARLNSMLGCQKSASGSSSRPMQRHSAVWVEGRHQALTSAARSEAAAARGVHLGTTDSLVSLRSPTEGHTRKPAGLASFVGMPWSSAVCATGIVAEVTPSLTFGVQHGNVLIRRRTSKGEALA